MLTTSAKSYVFILRTVILLLVCRLLYDRFIVEPQELKSCLQISRQQFHLGEIVADAVSEVRRLGWLDNSVSDNIPPTGTYEYDVLPSQSWHCPLQIELKFLNGRLFRVNGIIRNDASE